MTTTASPRLTHPALTSGPAVASEEDVAADAFTREAAMAMTKETIEMELKCWVGTADKPGLFKRMDDLLVHCRSCEPPIEQGAEWMALYADAKRRHDILASVAAERKIRI